jgi:hypothetical protein
VLVTIFALAVSVYFTGLYFEVFAPPKILLSHDTSYAELPPAAPPAVDREGRLIHMPPGIARPDVEVALSVRTVMGDWRVTCFHRPLGGQLWTPVLMTDFSQGKHGVKLPPSAFPQGAVEYYFEALSLSSGGRVRSGTPEAPFRIQTR